MSWSVSGGLPSGMSFSGGILSGTPSAATMPSGASFEVTANYKGNQVKKTYTIAVSSNAPVAEDVVTSTSFVDFGSVAINSTEKRSVVLTNNGSSSLGITAMPSIAGSPVFSKDAYTCGATLAAGQSCTTEVVFSPTAAGVTTATLTFSTSVAGAPKNIVLRGTAFNPVAMTTTSLPEGEQWSAYTPFDFKTLLTVSNESAPDLASAVISHTGALPTGMTLTGGVLSGTPTSATPTEGAPLEITVAYKGNSATQTYTLRVEAPAQPPLPPPSAAEINISVGSIDFGAVATNTTERRPVTLTNNAMSGLTITSGPTVSGGAAYSKESSTCAAILPAGQSCTTEVTYSPTSVGASTATLRFTTAVAGIPADVTIKGTAYNPVTLLTSALLVGNINKPYTAFNFNTLFKASNEATPTLALITWQLYGSLPTGMTFVNGVLAGTPLEATSSSIEVAATYKGNTYQQSYVVKIDHNPPVAADITTSTSIVDFGTVPTNTVESRQVLLINNAQSGLSVTAAPSVSAGVIYKLGSHDCGTRVEAGESCYAEVEYQPTAVGASTATLKFTTAIANAPALVTLKGTGVNPLTLTAASLPLAVRSTAYTGFDFKDLLVASNESIVDTSEVVWAPVGALPPGMALAGSVLQGTPTTTSIATGTAFQVKATYKSNVIQAAYALKVVAAPVAADIVTSTALLDFGEIGTNTTERLTVTLTNRALAPLNLTASSVVTGGPAISQESTTCASTLDAGASCAVVIKFNPTEEGASTGTLKFNTAVVGAPAVVNIKGKGVNPISFIQSVMVPRGDVGKVYKEFDFATLLQVTNEPNPVGVVWSIEGALPPGLTFNNGKLSGTPTAETVRSGMPVVVQAAYNGNISRQLYNVKVGEITLYAKKIVQGETSACALTLDNRVKCWGSNTKGQLGDGTYVSKTAPSEVIFTANQNGSRDAEGWPIQGYSTFDPIVDIGGGGGLGGVGYDFYCATTQSGISRCWGDGSFAQLSGSTSFTGNPYPVGPMGSFSTVRSYTKLGTTKSGNHMCGITINGGIQCSGTNDARQVTNTSTDGTSRIYDRPVTLPGMLSGVLDVGGGAKHTCALNDSGAVGCWGAMGFNKHQLGDGNVRSGVVQLSVGPWHTCALMVTGEVKCWGDNAKGQLGDGLPLGQVPSRAAAMTVVGLSSGVKSVEAGADNTCAIMNSGEVRCTGQGASPTKATPVDLLKHGVALASVASPGPKSLSSGPLGTCAIMAEDNVVCWGSGARLGYGGPIFEDSDIPLNVRNSPLSFQGNKLPRAKEQIRYSYDLSPLLKSTKDAVINPLDVEWSVIAPLPPGLFLGNNGVVSGYATTPTSSIDGDGFQVKAEYKGREVVSTIQLGVEPNGFKALSAPDNIAINTTRGCALSEIGELYCWGRGPKEWLAMTAVPPAAGLPVPTKSTAFTGKAKKIQGGDYKFCLITESNALMCWGLVGTLGGGVMGSVAVIPGMETGVTDVAVSNKHICAIKSGGLHCFGYNEYGELGIGTTGNNVTLNATPVLGLSTDVASVSTAHSHVCAVKTNGALLCWGNNLSDSPKNLGVQAGDVRCVV